MLLSKAPLLSIFDPVIGRINQTSEEKSFLQIAPLILFQLGSYPEKTRFLTFFVLAANVLDLDKGFLGTPLFLARSSRLVP